MTSAFSGWQQLNAARHRAEFYRMWLVAVSAGFTVPHTMQTIGARDDASTESFRRMLMDGTLRGRNLRQVVRADGAPVTPFEAALLSLGDETGQLETSIRLLAGYFERRQRHMLVVRKRLAYPMFTAVCAAFIAPVPLLLTAHPSAYVITVVSACTLLLVMGGTFVIAAAERFGRAPQLVRARLARALAVAIEAGLPLDRAVRLSVAATDDDRIRRYFATVDDRRLASAPLASTFSACPLMTPEFLAVLANAERTGDFTSTLVKLANLYDDGFR